MQGGRRCNIPFVKKMEYLGYQRCTADRSYWVRKTDQGINYVLLYIDDYFIASNDADEVKRIETKFA